MYDDYYRRRPPSGRPPFETPYPPPCPGPGMDEMPGMDMDDMGDMADMAEMHDMMNQMMDMLEFLVHETEEIENLVKQILDHLGIVPGDEMGEMPPRAGYQDQSK